MIEATVNLYEFKELSETAQENAFSYWYQKCSIDDFSGEYRAIIEILQSKLRIFVKNWSIDDCNYYYHIVIKDEWHDAECLQGLRAFKFIVNKVNPKKPKYIRHENCQPVYYTLITEDEFLNGFCAGDCLAQEYNELFKLSKAELDQLTYLKFCRGVLNRLFKEWQEDIIYQASEENFKENYAQDKLYLKDGQIPRFDYCQKAS